MGRHVTVTTVVFVCHHLCGWQKSFPKTKIGLFFLSLLAPRVDTIVSYDDSNSKGSFLEPPESCVQTKLGANFNLPAIDEIKSN